MDDIFEIAGKEMQSAIDYAPYYEFRDLSNKIYNIIYSTRRLSLKDREMLKKAWHCYLDNVLFQSDAEYVIVDYRGKVYKENKFVDKFHRSGYRWKSTKKMLIERDWTWNNDGIYLSVKPEDFRLSFFEAQEKKRKIII